MLSKIFFTQFIFLAMLVCLNQTEECESVQSKIDKYFHKEEYYVIFNDFYQFNELILGCNETYKAENFIIFKPTNAIIIDKSFKLNDIINNNGKSYTICMVNLKGIEIDSEYLDLTDSEFYYTFSDLDFYSNSVLIDTNYCTEDTFYKTSSFFTNFRALSFIYVKYNQEVCPFLFKDTYLDTIYFTAISNSLINYNLLNIIELNITRLDLNASIKTLILEQQYSELTFNILNKNVFEKLEELKIYGYLEDIQSDLFYSFNDIESIDLQLDNFKAFFHKGNKWMVGLNSGIKVNLSNQQQIQRFFRNKLTIRFFYKQNKSFINEIYEYPDKDFCLFKHFPHDRMVVPLILPGKKIQCSCTLIWLIQYYKAYFNFMASSDYDATINYNYASSDFYLDDTQHVLKYCHNEDLKSSIKACEFEKRLKLCNNISFNYESSSFQFDNDTDFLFLIKWLQLIMVIIIQPLLCFIGIINNLITIVVIKNRNNKKDFKDKMYKHIVINSAFNIIFCLIMIFGLVNQCLFYTSNMFCSKIYETKSSQYFKIIAVYFCGNVFKLAKNFSFLAFTFSRYILSLNKKKGFYRLFNNMNLKLYMVVLIFISTVLSLHKLFEYSVETSMDLTSEFPIDKYSVKQCEKEPDAYCDLFNVLKMINIFINDIALYLINFVIDIILVKDYSAYLSNKQKLLGSMSTHHKDTEDSKIKENRVARMVVISNTFYLLTSLPEFILSIVINFFSREISHFSNFNFKSSLIIEESEVFCLLSIVFNFYILIIFNRNFKQSFNFIINRLFKKIK